MYDDECLEPDPEETPERPWYSDACPHCWTSNVTSPLRIRRSPNGKGVSVTYMCSKKHTWTTGWAWWEGKPHPTEDDDPPTPVRYAGTRGAVSEW